MIDALAPVQLSRIGDILQEPLDPMPALERSPLLSRLLSGLPDEAIDALLEVTGPELSPC